MKKIAMVVTGLVIGALAGAVATTIGRYTGLDLYRGLSTAAIVFAICLCGFSCKKKEEAK